jgi:hypothetical protein
VSDLHPRARALIDAAKRSEGSLSPDVKARVHRSVLRRAVALGAAVATAGTTSAVSKAAALLAALPSSLAMPAMITAVAGAALVVLEARSTPPAPPPSPPVSMHAVAPAAGPRPRAAVGEAPVVVPFAAPGAPEPSATEEPTVANDEAALPAAPMTHRATVPVLVAPPRPHARASQASVAAPERDPLPLAPASAEPRHAGQPPFAGIALPDAHPSTSARLAEEIALLQQAHQALRAGNPAAALSLLDGPTSPLDASPLAEEAQLARISALCQLGRAAEAHTATERLLATWPGSPASKRLGDGCAVLAAPSKGSED